MLETHRNEKPTLEGVGVSLLSGYYPRPIQAIASEAQAQRTIIVEETKVGYSDLGKFKSFIYPSRLSMRRCRWREGPLRILPL